MNSDRSAFEDVYYHYYSILLQIAYKKLADEHRAEEVVQDVFINLWLKRENLNPDGDIYAYLYATLRNRILHELRTIMNMQKHIKSWDDKVDVIGKISPEDKYIALETADSIQTIINSLPPQCQVAFILSRQQQLSNKEIAKEMGISVNTVEKHIGKALRIIREQQKKGMI